MEMKEVVLKRGKESKVRRGKRRGTFPFMKTAFVSSSVT